MDDSDSRSWMSCLGWGCLALVVVSVLGIGGCIAFVYQGGKGAHEVASGYLEAVDEGRYEEAFAALGDDFADAEGLESFSAFEQGARSELGRCGSWKTRGTSFNRSGGRSYSKLTFLGECDGAAVTASLLLEETDGRWVVQDIHYNESVGAQTDRIEVCPDCGGAVPPGARFCPSCGARIAEAANVGETGGGANESTAVQEVEP